MRVALSMRVTEAPGHDEKRDAISHDWIRRLEDWDMIPLPVPNALAAPATFLAALDADLLVLTGGDDLGTSAARDDTETALLTHAIAARLPVIGVCRGLQAINVHFRGTLIAVEGHVARPHKVAVTPEWETDYGAAPEVNSFHDWAITEESLAPPLRPWARDEDGRIEAVVYPGGAIAGVMWHPERSGAPEGDARLFRRLAAGEVFPR